MEAILPEVLSTTIAISGIAINGDILMGLEVVVFAMTLMGGALFGDFGVLGLGSGASSAHDGVSKRAIKDVAVKQATVKQVAVKYAAMRAAHSKSQLARDELVIPRDMKRHNGHPGGPFLFTFQKPSLANQQIC